MPYMHYIYYILYTLYSILYTLYSTPYTLYPIPYTLYYILYTIYYILYTIDAQVEQAGDRERLVLDGREVQRREAVVVLSGARKCFYMFIV